MDGRSEERSNRNRTPRLYCASRLQGLRSMKNTLARWCSVSIALLKSEGRRTVPPQPQTKRNRYYDQSKLGARGNPGIPRDTLGYPGGSPGYPERSVEIRSLTLALFQLIFCPPQPPVLKETLHFTGIITTTLLQSLRNRSILHTVEPPVYSSP